MRQAGRYQPEYRDIRRSRSLLEICRDPRLAARVTRLPVERLGVDAAILFSDIMVPLSSMGVDFDIREGVGPVLARPVRDRCSVDAIRPLPPGEPSYVMETVSRLRDELGVPLIGFAGAPFTLASYLVEGAPSRQWLATKRFMYASPGEWHELMRKLSEAMAAYLASQVAAGAAAVQIFDSWAGALSPADYDEYVRPHLERLLAALEPLGVPRILFSADGGSLLECFRDAGADVVGVDWRVPLSRARARLGQRVPLQGNLDPVSLLAPWPVLAGQVDRVLKEAAGGPHVFNLGHGVLPETDPETLRRVVERVHEAGVVAGNTEGGAR